MSLFKKLFGPREPPPPVRDVAGLVKPLSRPAIHVVKSPAATGSYFGGAPSLPPGLTWPSKDGRPLPFLACLDLEALNRVSRLPWLPASGALLIFYDIEGQPWGFDPKDRGSWAVVLAPGPVPPAASPVSTGLTHQYVTFRAIDSVPSWERPEVAALGLSDAESDILIDLCSASYADAPAHQVGGFPNPVQSDEMELECQMASTGIYAGDAEAYRRNDLAGLRAAAQHWRLLLQVDSDDSLGAMWGDAGMLYFWVDEREARAGRFDQAWLVLQCH
jgi:uncharacterized protein YwqG